LQCCIGFVQCEGFDFYENLDGLFIFALIDVIVRDVQCSEKLFDQVVETLMFITPVLQYGIEGTIVETDPFDDRIAFDVVVIVIKF